MQKIWAELDAYGWQIHRATSFLSNTVGSLIKWNVEDVNCGKMIERPVYRQGAYNYVTERSVKDATVWCDVCPKACLLFYNTLKSVYFFFTKRVHTLKGNV